MNEEQKLVHAVLNGRVRTMAVHMGKKDKPVRCTVRGLTIDDLKALSPGDIVYLQAFDGKLYRWRVSGQPKTWVRQPERVKVPIKHGLYSNSYITDEDYDNAWVMA